jgi:acetyltransferase-like isoleucine patch superfamily enzyme
MRYAGVDPVGRIATRLASWFTPPFYGRQHLAKLNPNGYISPSATIHHTDLRLSTGTFIDDRVLIYQDNDGGPVELGKQVLIYRDSIIQTGVGGSVTIGAYSSLQPRCQLSAYKASIQLGSNVQIAPNCAFYPYNHGVTPGSIMRQQPLQTKGGIILEDDVWLGVGVIVLDGVRIGKGAVVGAGSVVTQDIPDGAIALGVPARVVKMRTDLSNKTLNTDEMAGQKTL